MNKHDEYYGTYFNQPNQMRRELLGVCSLMPWPGGVSASRIQMFSSHIGQRPTLKTPTERRIITGTEREFGKYTFNKKMPCDGRVIRVIHRFNRTMDRHSIDYSPQSVMLYENSDTNEVGVIDLRRFRSEHQYFGFQYRRGPGMGMLSEKSYIPKGTVFLESPAVRENGDYDMGVHLNMAYMSHPAVSEDGIMICEDVLHLFKTETYETRVVSYGRNAFAVNLYGDENNYKPFPDIGDYVRPDGLLMCLRDYRPEMAIVNKNIYSTRTVNHMFDKATYVPGGRGRVVDIRITHRNRPYDPVDMDMDALPYKYETATRDFYQQILDTYRDIQRNSHNTKPISLELSSLIEKAISICQPNYGNNEEPVRKLHRKVELDTWRIEFVVQYEITPNIGHKLTDLVGGKGVICYIAKSEEMPVDAAGNRADIVMDGGSTVNRNNPARNIEQFLAATARDATFRLRQLLAPILPATPRHGEPDRVRYPGIRDYMEDLSITNPELFNQGWEYLMRLYEIISPRMANWFRTGAYRKPHWEHMAKILEDTPVLYVPAENEPEYLDIVRQCHREYPATYGPVTYRDTAGKMVSTVNPVRVGGVYIISLEKIGDSWTAVSSAKIQISGILSQVSNNDKYATPTRQQPIRSLGEAEVRLLLSYVGPRITAWLLDRNNNPLTHKNIVRNLLRAANPCQVYQSIDRNEVPLGGAMPTRRAKHILACAGIEFCYNTY